MSSPKISVIIPIYGTEKYLDKCLLSVRGQTFKDIEIICVDDCSPDNSYKIVEEHCKQDKRVVLIRHEKNLGLGGARNTGIRAAKADYLASVDSDDYMSKDMLEILWKATDNGWFDIICCGFNRVDGNGNILSKYSYPEKQIFNDNNSVDIFSTLNPAFWNKLWRKSLFVENDIYFPEHDYYEDMSTTPRLLAKARYAKVIKDALYFYLVRDQSIINSVTDKHIIDYLKGFEILSKFLKENNLSQHYVDKFHLFIRGNFNYFTKSIIDSQLSLDKKNQYLRFLILFRITFVENFNKFRYLGVSDLLARLNEKELHGVYYDKYQNVLEELNKKEGLIAKHLSEIEEKVRVIKDKEELIKNKEYEISQLFVCNNTVKSELKISNREMSVVKKHLLLLESEIAQKVSLAQMFAVLLFAVLTYFFMSKKQRLKLINKPKIFFRDSRNSFARSYASWFKLI